MAYRIQEDLLNRRYELGVTNRDIGNAIGMAPGTLGPKLNGFSPLYEDERAAITKYLNALSEKSHRGSEASKAISGAQ